MDAPGPDSPSAGTSGAPLKYKLKSEDPNVADIDFADQQEVSAGRLSSNNLSITGNPYVSSTHFRVLYHGPSLFVLDLSRNGTWVGPKPTELRKVGQHNRKLIRPGDYVTMLDPAIEQNAGKLLFQFTVIGSQGQDSQEHWGDVSKVYKIGRPLGKGNFAVVYHAHHVHDVSQEVAIKIVDKKKLALGNNGDYLMHKMLDEVRLLKSIDHSNVIRIVDVFDNDKYLCIALDLVKGGDLFDYVVNSKFTESEAKYLFKQIIEALLYLHSKNVAHRDLKPENVLVATVPGFTLPPQKHQSGYSKAEVPVADVVLKLTDFGLAKWTGDSQTMMTYCGTPLYVAPEVHTATKKNQKGDVKGYTLAVDMWSAGVLLYILLTSVSPRDPHKGIRFPEKHWKSLSDQAQDLVAQLLTINPDNRITLYGVCNHPWMEGMDIKGRELAVAPAPRKQPVPPAEEPDAVFESQSDKKRPRTSDSAAAGEGSEAKKARVDDDATTEAGEDDEDQRDPLWSWKSSFTGSDDTSWTPYTPEENKRIEEAYAVFLEGKRKTVRVNKMYKIDFENRFQWNINDETKQRSVRRV
eukprot:TRINITY_DN50444_c0_g1_i1.p1 TRINITY_DN50444_c0_g1~~TRINITY_DN50444_c0_g1_i1.p1  ORF type:complete len:603 (+),score=227.77 TRINITY_DN50444_c0_g1_i1:80-1810(+)